MAASRAPFGTDLQPNFDVRVVGGKIIHTPAVVANAERQLGFCREINKGTNKTRSKDTSISGAIKAHKKIKESQGLVPMKAVKGVSRPRSKRARSINILPILEEGAAEAPEEPSPLKVANRTFVQPPPRKTENKLPSIVIQPVQTENVVHSTEDQGEEASRLQVRELCTLVETIFKPVVNKLGAVRNIRATCNRADSANLGVLERGTVVRAFRSHGARMSSKELPKLCELIPCSMGSEHILYDKLCTVAEQVLTNSYPNEETDSNTLTPLGSIGSASPDSVENYKLGCSLPMLADRTNSIHHSLPQERPLDLFGKFGVSRGKMTHPLSQSHSVSNTAKLPQISEPGVKHAATPAKTAPPLGTNLSAKWPLSPGATEAEKEDGVEKMLNALRSCTDSQGELVMSVCTTWKSRRPKIK